MLCKKPFLKGALTFGCGQCLCCRISRRRLWAHRMMLEGLAHSESSFVTLTYAPENLPAGASLVPKHTQDWLKRLRKEVGPLRLRYFLVGEYGDLSQRPHYHLALFGLGPSCQKLVEKTWSHGHVLIGTLTKYSAEYIAQYVTKKMTSKNDGRLNGRHPEFARMSLRPGIGALSLQPVVEALALPGVLAGLDGDAPRVLMHGRSVLPLGRYLRGKLREAIYGKSAVQLVKEQALERWCQELSGLWKGSYSCERDAARSGSEIVVDRDRQSLLNMESRYEIYRSRGSL